MRSTATAAASRSTATTAVRGTSTAAMSAPAALLRLGGATR
jgi:hypothetical protein